LKSSKTSEVLSSIPYFAQLDVHTLESISQAALRRTFDAGQVVFLEGEPNSGLYAVQEGWLRSVKISTAGREQVIRFVGPGEMFNEIGVFAGGLNQVTVEALEPSVVWIIPRETLLSLMDKHPSLCRLITQNLAERVLHLISLVEDLSLRTVEERLARLLLEQSRGDLVSRRRWSTQAELAARLGTVPDVMNRALRSLSEEGLIHIERRQIHILNRQGLQAKAKVDEKER
jgi:CRP/FNR family transcriptional regulator